MTNQRSKTASELEEQEEFEPKFWNPGGDLLRAIEKEIQDAVKEHITSDNPDITMRFLSPPSDRNFYNQEDENEGDRPDSLCVKTLVEVQGEMVIVHYCDIVDLVNFEIEGRTDTYRNTGEIDGEDSETFFRESAEGFEHCAKLLRAALARSEAFKLKQSG